MSLTDTAIRNPKPGPKPYKLQDERGLFQIVTPTGHNWWRVPLYLRRQGKLLSLGVFPAVALQQARAARDPNRYLSGALPPLKVTR